MSTNNFDKTIKGLSAQTIVTILSGIIEILVFSIMSRILSKADFGYYAALNSIFVIFQSLSEAGIGAAIIQKKEITNNYINTAFSLAFLLGTFFTLLLLLLSNLISSTIIDKSLEFPLVLVSMTLIPFSINSIARSLMMRELDFFKYGIIKLVAYIVSAIVAIIYAFNGGGFYAFILLNFINVLLLMILSFYFSRYRPKFVIKIGNVRSIVNFGGWLTLSRLIFSFYRQIDKLMLSKYGSIIVLGEFYRTKGFLDSIINQFESIFDTTLFPILSKGQDSSIFIRSAFIKSISLVGSVFMSLFMLFFFNAELIITIFLGDKWLDQALTMRILSCVILFSIYSRITDCFIRSLAYVKFYFCTCVLSCVLSFVVFYYVIDWGIEWIAAAVVLISFVIFLIKLCYLAYKVDITIIVIFKSIFKSMKYSIPYLMLGTLFLFYFNHNIGERIVFVFLFSLMLIFTYLFLPRFVGEVYYNQLYPIVRKYINVLKMFKVE
ncbi:MULTISPECIES: oligosaccharide flippase family protein [Butyricimonas]|jgi:polysaccharide biosynthesis protein tuaB|uniref:Oligosaccharide flippase family protein n=1 Tax=Butyricimonas hominis TaxID=2763032 RepID=A0ABR7CYM3_9BACT|nr:MULTISPECIES: oligosaccharide flippase family protein [Butyricimonas]MBC5620744.1 oligosaccharide flippase family protein [Butyricimonas hominis]MCB6970929.1 oligosaccharide flippase family protein [Butyricimonas synergistica]MCG4517643.1 oligosaccharide flippase family protein [Butyricimonas sp. DFI.6.44]